MEDMLPVVLGKYEFDNREKKIKEIFGDFLDYEFCDGKEKINDFSVKDIPTSVTKVFCCNLDEKNELVGTEK